MALFGHFMCLFLVCLFFFLSSSIYNEGLLPRSHGFFLCAFRASLIEIALFFFTVSVSQCLALLPWQIFSSLNFEYSSSIAGSKKLIAGHLDGISWSIIINLVSFFAALNFHTFTAKCVCVSFPFLMFFLLLFSLLTPTTSRKSKLLWYTFLQIEPQVNKGLLSY